MSANDPKQTLAHYVLRSTFTFHAPSNSLAAKQATAITPMAKTAAASFGIRGRQYASRSQLA